QITEFCRQADMAETTFGRRVVNDGKLVHRLREGKRITIDTLDRIHAYIAASTGALPPPRGLDVPPEKRDPRGNFRFFENRQKYLLFVHTCSEKRVTAERVALELGSIHPRPPALRVFDAGVGDGTVLARILRSMHGRFPGMPVYERPVAIVLYREDHRFLLDQIIPRAGRSEANFDLIIASQPYRAKSSVNFRAKRIIAPLARALRPGGRLIGIHSHGQDPGLEIIQAVWPGENPFSVIRL